MKDNFSKQAALYAQFRPVYPPGLFDFILSHTAGRQRLWDVATGNGQVAAALAPRFEEVLATDISERQLAHAAPAPNITYQLENAEACSAPDGSFDLITVGQAIHWFRFDAFYGQVRRVAKPGAVLAVIGYGMHRSLPPVEAAVDRLYRELLEGCWAPERQYIEEELRTIPFPFGEIACPAFSMRVRWTFENLVGYLNTWSAVQHYIRREGENPVDLLLPDLKKAWGEAGEVEVVFPLFLRVGRIG